MGFSQNYQDYISYNCTLSLMFHVPCSMFHEFVLTYGIVVFCRMLLACGGEVHTDCTISIPVNRVQNSDDIP